MDYGYSSSNYSTAFQKHHNISPTEFRKSTDVTDMTNPFYPSGLSGFDTFDGYNGRIKIQALPDFHVIYERFTFMNRPFYSRERQVLQLHANCGYKLHLNVAYYNYFMLQ